MAKEKATAESKYYIVNGKGKDGGDYSHKFLKSYINTLKDAEVQKLYKNTYPSEVISEVLKKRKAEMETQKP